MRYFPIFIDLEAGDVLIAGGGEKALQKLRLIAATPARVRIVSASVSAELRDAAAAAGASVHERAFVADDVSGATLVFAANDEPALDAEVAAAAKARGVALNVVDQPAHSTFIMPAIVDRDPVVVAIGTEGTAPILAREIKAKIEAWLPARFGQIAARARELRGRIKAAVGDPVQRRRLWEALLQGRWRTAVLAGDEALAGREFEQQLVNAQAGALGGGSVALIGCGPGEPDLLTLKAQQRLQEADVLVVDRLVNPAILDYARRDALRIEVGKTPGGPSAAQNEINQILVCEALKGQRVARLKGGDAFIFGRAAEEIAAVSAAGVPVEIVPGITAAHACAASVGLPLTLRQKVQQFAVVTGASAGETLDLDWESLARPGHAFAIYMGVRAAPEFRAKLLKAGAQAGTKVVIVENGTLPSERVVATELGVLDRAVAETGITGPAIIFVGLDWEQAGLSQPERVEVFMPPRAADAPRVEEGVGAGARPG